MPETARDEITRLEQEYEKDPEGRLFVHLAEAYRKSGELKRARELLQQGLEQHRDSVSARIVLAQVHGEMGDAEAARTVWQEVVERDEENELALRALASIEHSAGNRAEALGHYRQLQQLGVEDGEVTARIAELSPGGERRASAGAEQPGAVQGEKAAAPERAPRSVAAGGGAGGGMPAHTDAVGLSDLLVRLLEYRSSTFQADSSLTRLLSLSMGRELELERIHLDALALAALLSDLGSLALADHAPARPYASEESERTAEQREVAISLQLLQDIALPVGVHEAIRHQHERWDGSGYPDGLREEEIPYTARVLAVARACAERLTGTADGRNRSVREALDELQRQAGSRFDPVIVSVLRRVFQRRAEHGVGFGLGGRVLLVHPEELRSLGLATQLHNHGYVAEMVPELGRARARLRDASSEALVVGANLPTQEVARFVREVRGNTAFGGIPIVVIDANDMDLRVEMLTAGADVCFPSETNFREFKATLDALLRRREENAVVGT
jgi:HD-GYP domain-containing protein (c-di-GMP phosphodiesterase class II)